MSRSQVVKLLKENRVKLNRQPVQKKNIPIEIGDILDIELPETQIIRESYRPSIDFNRIKLYEDDYLLIIDKPPRISVHPGSGTQEETILDLFKFHYPQVDQIETPETPDQRPGIVHRLDKDTSGVLLLAKDIITMKRLQKQFKRREIKKTYLALVDGHLRYRSGTIDVPITRSQRNRTRFRVAQSDNETGPQARESVTRYKLVRQYPHFSFVKVFPLTGRTHQIRVHFSYLKNPILGDPAYGKKETFQRLALHAYAIEFYHPITRQLIMSCSPFPLIFRDYLRLMHHAAG
ncbi:MAG: RluA family pseudouridine synthase [bacterium]|nr:RluA family pseudouridine synthase [bacterium]